MSNEIMSKFQITGGVKLKGEIRVSGAKNAALKIIAASLLSEEEIKIKNVPEIQDVARMLEILQKLGVLVERQGDQLKISTKNISETNLPADLVPKIRTSIMFVGPMLARFGAVKMPHPGGCHIGKRPIDLFIEGFQALGVEVSEDENGYLFKTRRLKGGEFFFPWVSVTVTEALLMTAVLTQGKTVLKNCAMEPEIPALADYLNSQGAQIKGAGTSTIEINGVKKISAGEFQLIPDRIEAGSFAILGAATQNEITITNCQPDHLGALWSNFRRLGVNFERGSDFVKIKKPSRKYQAIKFLTHEYPGLATDLQAPLTVLLTQAQGISLVHETIFEGRLLYTDFLNRMGADIILCDPHRAIINGPTVLHGRKVESPDLRAGIALVIAGLIADGQTEIDNVYQIERGYENIVERLVALGAKIRRI